MTYITEDGEEVQEGDIVYDYYSMEVVQIGPPASAGWFDTLRPHSITQERPRGVTSRAGMLNGQRICSLRFARRRGFPGIERYADDGTPILTPTDLGETIR